MKKKNLKNFSQKHCQINQIYTRKKTIYSKNLPKNIWVKKATKFFSQKLIIESDKLLKKPGVNGQSSLRIEGCSVSWEKEWDSHTWMQPLPHLQHSRTYFSSMKEHLIMH